MFFLWLLLLVCFDEGKQSDLSDEWLKDVSFNDVSVYLYDFEMGWHPFPCPLFEGDKLIEPLMMLEVVLCHFSFVPEAEPLFPPFLQCCVYPPQVVFSLGDCLLHLLDIVIQCPYLIFNDILIGIEHLNLFPGYFFFQVHETSPDLFDIGSHNVIQQHPVMLELFALPL